jgi:methylmalonyl-CoA/ethylmalonyl-CoA epimerase
MQQTRFLSTIPSKLWNIGRLNRIRPPTPLILPPDVAIATSDLTGQTAFYRDILGASVSPQAPLPAHGVTTVFINLQNTKLELLQPLGPNSPIQKFLDKNTNGGIHHVCLEVDDITSAMVSLKGAGVRALSETPKIGAHGLPVIFLHPKDCGGVLVELEECKASFL